MNTITQSIINTPANGSTYLHDASIETSEWLESLFGKPVELKVEETFDAYGNSKGHWDNDAVIRSACEDFESVEQNESVQLVEACRDNVYNAENDFGQVFTFTVYSTPNDQDEWYYGNDAVYIAVCLHLGGDVRGNYGDVSVYRCDDSDKLTAFLDWTIGWHVTEGETGELVPGGAHFMIGYSSNRTCGLARALDGDDACECNDGDYHDKLNGRAVVCAPETSRDHTQQITSQPQPT